MDYGIKPLGRERFWLWMLLVPTLFGLMFSVFGSLLATIGLSFTKWDLLSPPRWAGMSNYIDLFTNEKFLKSLWNTAKFSALYVPGVVIISLLVAVLLNRKIRGRWDFPHRLLSAGGDLCRCHCPGLEHDLRQGYRDTELLSWRLLHLQPVCWLCTDNAMVSVVIVNIWGAIGEGHDHLPGRPDRHPARVL